MDRFMDIIKRHPFWILGGVVALVLIFWWSSGSSGSGQPTIVSVGPSDMTVAQNAETERARIAAQAQGAAGVVAKELASIQADAYTQFLSTSRDVADIQADRDVDIAGIAGSTQTSLATIAGNTQTSLASIVTGAQTSQTQIVANAQTSLATIDKSKAESLANINAALEKEKIAGQVASAQAAANASVQTAQIKANSDYSILLKKVEEASNWYYWALPGNLNSIWGNGPDTVNNVTVNQQGGTVMGPSAGGQ